MIGPRAITDAGAQCVPVPRRCSVRIRPGRLVRAAIPDVVGYLAAVRLRATTIRSRASD
jgi:hypothetical protein